MKTFILTLSIAMVFAACSNNQSADNSTSSSVVVQDTNGLAQFKDWRQKQDLMAANETINNDGFETEPIEETPQKVAPVVTKTRVIYRDSPVSERKAKVTKPAAKDRNYDGERTARSRTSLPETTTHTDNGPTTNNGSGEVGTETGSGDVAVSTPTEVEKEKNEGWSKAAKGTAIGAGSGAVLGAILSKNKGKGAAIGGVIGAAGGYIFGRKQDKKDGRN